MNTSPSSWSIEKLKSFINLKFQDSYQSVEDFPANEANGSPEIAKLNQRIEKLEYDIFARKNGPVDKVALLQSVLPWSYENGYYVAIPS